MSQSLNEAPVTDAAVAARNATEASLKAAMEAPLASERDPAIERLATQIDIADPGSILRFGAEAQSRATAAADAMLEGARNREAGEAGATLSSLLGTLRGFDMSGLAAKRGFFARMFNRAGAEAFLQAFMQERAGEYGLTIDDAGRLA